MASMSKISGGSGPVFRSNAELYDFAFAYVDELNGLNRPELANAVDRALRGGATSGEILTYLGLAFRDVTQAGIDDPRVAEATLAINQALGLPRKYRG
jgi:hypothetical protein